MSLLTAPSVLDFEVNDLRNLTKDLLESEFDFLKPDDARENIVETWLVASDDDDDDEEEYEYEDDEYEEEEE